MGMPTLRDKIYKILCNLHADSMAIEPLSIIGDQIAELFPDSQQQQSVMQDWTRKIPLRAQGTLLTCVRGCDLAPKFPLDSPERVLVGMLRHAFLVPADPREVGVEPGAFFQNATPADIDRWRTTTKFSAFGHYPQHWVAHVMHAAEVLGYCHPNPTLAISWQHVYFKFCHAHHVPPETYDAFLIRMTEDRIATGTVVS